MHQEDEKRLYTDGSVEEDILNYLQQHGNQQGIIEELAQGAVFHNFTDARTGLLRWYPFSDEDDVLEVGAGMGALTPYLSSVCKRVTALEPSPRRAEIIKARCQPHSNVQIVTGSLSDIAPNQLFDKVLLIGVLEYASISDDSENPWLRLLQDARAYLKPNGKLLLAIENRFGLKYWCGAAEDHTGIPFDSINDYQLSNGQARSYTTNGVRTFSSKELETLLHLAGFHRNRFYYPLPDYKFPMLILSDDSINGASLSRDVKYTYPEESLLIADERKLMPQVIGQGYLRLFANSFLIEAMDEDTVPCAVATALIKRDYATPYRLDTVMEANRVTRRASSAASLGHLRELEENTRILVSRGVSCVNQVCSDDGESVADYITAIRADEVFAAALRRGNMRLAAQMLEQLRLSLLKSSTYELQDGSIILHDGFLDLTFRNSFWNKDTLLFFDQEWRTPKVSLNYLLYRSIHYACQDFDGQICDEVFQACGITQGEREQFSEMEAAFLKSLMDPMNCQWFDGMMYQERLTVVHRLTETNIRNEELGRETESLRGELQRKMGHLELLLQSERDLRAEVSGLERVEQEQATHIGDLARLEREQRVKITALEQTEREQTARIGELERQKQEQTAQIAGLERQKQEQMTRIAGLERLEQENMAQITKLTRLEQEYAAQIVKLEGLKQEQVAQIAGLEEDLRNKVGWVEQLLQSERELRNRVVQMQQEILKRDGHIQQLLEPERELNRIKVSRSWRFMGYIWKARDILIPQGSKRRLAGKLLVRFLKHPLHFLGKSSPRRLGKFFYTLRREGVESVSRRLDECLIGNELPQARLVVENIGGDADMCATITKTAVADYAPLTVPQWDKPVVSIVIPVFNQFDYTYACIKSVLQNSCDVAYELIVADDCSTDLTTRIDEIVHGLHTIRNSENLRFLRNCNNAARAGRGKYLLFLNNDTQVQENWLKPLVDLLDNDPTIGLAGSKLVYPDGRLQEAGGIFWRDGSAWNYGNRSDPALPEYNYVKDVDYISGASICIRRALWEEIGGFDDRFAPAYCEDSDLAFEVRKRGRRVVYQPLSVVVHFEGVSNGTDTAAGQKAYQETNQKKLYEKWKEILEAEHFPNGEQVFLARDRSRGKKTLLIVDHYVPMFDQDAGSRTVFQYLKLFVAEGFHVKFIGDNFFAHQPYTQVLQQMGIEVLVGPYYANHWKDWLKDHGANIGYVFLNRPHIAPKYIDAVRKYTPAKLIYYGHDLHFLREQREYEITGDPALLKSSEEWREKELSLMRRADVAYYPSCVEEREIRRLAPDVNVRAIPAYLFSDIQETPYIAARRKDAMFIGGFGHRPNVDGVKWLAEEVMPHLTELLPDLVVYILGSHPPEEIKALESAHLRIKGFVTDEELERFYGACRMAIVPLRYGAGIKGKVVEAMRYGMPVVTTAVGAEGISGAEAILEIADGAEDFARKAAALYQDGEGLAARSAASCRFIRDHFSPENARRILKLDFDLNEGEKT